MTSEVVSATNKARSAQRGDAGADAGDGRRLSGSLSGRENALGMTLIDELIREQQVMTAVERFSKRHDSGALPAQARYYRDLIPLAKPGPGQQYQFVVELDSCTGCKACVSACHSLNGLDENETWRSVGFIHGSGADGGYLQTVTSACHHCLEPGCLEGCPVMAYEKDEITGIVRHLDDQCIGCQYCVLKCPYDVPKYSESRGIVRKCDMCSDRLAHGEAPACVQACPTQAIRIELVEKKELVASITQETRMLPGVFPSEYTKPATRYVTRRRPAPGNATHASAAALRKEHAHWPLVGMLLLTQASLGLFLFLWMKSTVGASNETLNRVVATVAFVLLHTGLAVSILHLGLPLGAWRFFLGLRTSWMSREILAFGIYSAASEVCAAAVWFSSLLRDSGANSIAKWAAETARAIPAPILNLLLWRAELLPTLGAAATGCLAVYCSAMIYIDTKRPIWNGRRTAVKFGGTVVILGGAVLSAVLSFSARASAGNDFRVTVLLVLLTIIVQAAITVLDLKKAAADVQDPCHESSQVLLRLFAPQLAWELAALAGALAAGALCLVFGESAWLAVAFLAFIVVSQTIERYLFFTAAAAPRMPGGITA